MSLERGIVQIRETFSVPKSPWTLQPAQCHEKIKISLFKRQGLSSCQKVCQMMPSPNGLTIRKFVLMKYVNATKVTRAYSAVGFCADLQGRPEIIVMKFRHEKKDGSITKTEGHQARLTQNERDQLARKLKVLQVGGTISF